MLFWQATVNPTSQVVCVVSVGTYRTGETPRPPHPTNRKNASLASPCSYHTQKITPRHDGGTIKSAAVEQRGRRQGGEQSRRLKGMDNADRRDWERRGPGDKYCPRRHEVVARRIHDEDRRTQLHLREQWIRDRQQPRGSPPREAAHEGGHVPYGIERR